MLPTEPGIEILASSSDHLILDVEEATRPIQVGDILEFHMYYGPMMFMTGTNYVNIICK